MRLTSFPTAHLRLSFLGVFPPTLRSQFGPGFHAAWTPRQRRRPLCLRFLRLRSPEHALAAALSEFWRLTNSADLLLGDPRAQIGDCLRSILGVQHLPLGSGAKLRPYVCARKSDPYGFAPFLRVLCRHDLGPRLLREESPKNLVSKGWVAHSRFAARAHLRPRLRRWIGNAIPSRRSVRQRDSIPAPVSDAVTLKSKTVRFIKTVRHHPHFNAHTKARQLGNNVSVVWIVRSRDRLSAPTVAFANVETDVLVGSPVLIDIKLIQRHVAAPID